MPLGSGHVVLSISHSPPLSYLAGEAFRVPLSIEGSDKALHDGLVATLAVWGVVLIVALSTEGLAVLLMETLWTKLLPTQGAEEMLRMPGLV